AGSAAARSSDPSARISALSNPCALVISSLLKELVQTSSARRSVRCAGVRRTGRISSSVTSWPRAASCHAASQPARPPPTTVTAATTRCLLPSGGLRLRDGVRVELGLALRAPEEGAAGLGRLFDEERRLAVRARRGDGSVPGGPVALGVTSAAPERLAAPRALLADVALAATRALEPGDGARAGEAALRVVRARDERAQPALPLDELA